MALPQFTLKDLLEAGVHFGHKSHRWNPAMGEFIYGERHGIHIMDLRQTVPMLYQSLAFLRQTVAGGGRVLFVGSKRQAQDIVEQTAGKTGQYYVNHRWLGGMLTNWKTINKSIRRLKELEEIFANEEEKAAHLTKMELLKLQREHDKLYRSLGGIKDMGGLPDAVVVLDTVKQKIAVDEANRLGIPVVGIIDSNSTPEGVDYPVPGNDDSTRALQLYCSLMADAILDGISEQLAKAGNKGSAQSSNSKADQKTVVSLSPKASAAATKDAEAEAAEETADSKKPATTAKSEKAEEKKASAAANQ